MFKHYIMIDKVQDFIQDNSPTVLTAMFTTITFIDAVDFFLRCLSGFITIVMFYFSMRTYQRKRKVNDIDQEIKQQQLYDLIQTNNKKHGTKRIR